MCIRDSTLPLAIFTAFLFIYPPLKKGDFSESGLEAELQRMEREPLSFRLFIPLLVLIALFAGERVFPSHWPSLGMPLTFLLAAASALFSGVKWHPLQTVINAINDALPVMGILMGVGTVSYTHLDVYKRQALERSMRFASMKEVEEALCKLT